MLRAGRDQPLSGRAHREVQGGPQPEERAQPPAQGGQAGALLEAEDAHPGELGGRAALAQQAGAAGPRRTDEDQVCPATARDRVGGGFHARELRFLAVELAEADAIGREPLALALQWNAERGGEGLDHLVGLRIPRARLPGEQLAHHRLDAGAGAGRRDLLEVGAHHLDRRGGREGIHAGEQLVQRDSQGVEIGRRAGGRSFQHLGSGILEAPARGGLGAREPPDRPAASSVRRLDRPGPRSAASRPRG